MLQTAKMSSICNVQPICYMGFINYFGVPAYFAPFLSTSKWGSVSQIKFLQPLRQQGSLQCLHGGQESKNNKLFFFYRKKVSS